MLGPGLLRWAQEAGVPRRLLLAILCAAWRQDVFRSSAQKRAVIGPTSTFPRIEGEQGPRRRQARPDIKADPDPGTIARVAKHSPTADGPERCFVAKGLSVLVR